jgi:hypothetical protein
VLKEIVSKLETAISGSTCSTDNNDKEHGVAAKTQDELPIANRPLPIVSQVDRFYLLQTNAQFSIGNAQCPVLMPMA